MTTEITMPKLSDTMTEGRLISWKRSVGEKVERGDIIAEVETDKANMELEAFTSGTLLKTLVKPGEMTPVGAVIAIIGEDGEAGVDHWELQSAPPPQPENRQPQPPVQVPGEFEAQKGEALKPAARPAAGAKGEEEKASPMVRRLARERGINLKLVAGSGPDGRIIMADLDRLRGRTEPDNKDQSKGEAAAIPAQEDAMESSGDRISLPLSRMRAAIARTVTSAWQEIPHFTATVAIRMDEAEEVRRELKESGTSLTINDMIVKAAAISLRKHPQVNSSFAGDRIYVISDINIGLVVSLEDGLLVPVIRGCQGLTLKQIAVRSRELIELAMSGRISENEIKGGTFTITNMGMFGVEDFTAIIYPPQGAILAVGAVHDEAIVKGGALCVARVMRVTLSADHRLMDGAHAARFLQELKRVLENPVSLLL